MKFSDADGLIRTAIKSVPVVRYALGLAAIAILVSIARGANPDIGLAGMVPVIVATLILMTLLIIIAAISESRSVLAGPAALVTWSASLALVVILAASVSAMLIGWPPQWADLILPKAVAEKPPVASTPSQVGKPTSSAPEKPAGNTSALPPQSPRDKTQSVDQLNNSANVPQLEADSTVEKPFDCAKAAMPLDWAICADSEAYRLNTRMGALWTSEHDQMNQMERRVHVQDQLNWIYFTQRKCGLPAKGKPKSDILNAVGPCVRAAYSARIATLQSR